MTRFEDLLKRSELCYATSFKVRGAMRTMWQWKALQLKEQAYGLTVEQANQVVKHGTKSDL